MCRQYALCVPVTAQRLTHIIIAAQYALRYITHVHAGLGRVNGNECASCLLT